MTETFKKMASFANKLSDLLYLHGSGLNISLHVSKYSLHAGYQVCVVIEYHIITPT